MTYSTVNLWLHHRWMTPVHGISMYLLERIHCQKWLQTCVLKLGLSGKKTNYSLRVSGTSCLFEAGVPEKLIQQRTGHRTLESLRMYERVTDKQQLAVSKVLTGEKNTYEDAEREKVL